MIVVYTDGACSGNPGPGGWAWAVAPDGAKHAAGGEAATTNQRMELYAAIEALRSLGTAEPIKLVSDSLYVVKGIREWVPRWLKNGWVNSKRQAVANSDLWRLLVELDQAADVEFGWVKGHSGDHMNDLVDRLAVAAIPR